MMVASQFGKSTGSIYPFYFITCQGGICNCKLVLLFIYEQSKTKQLTCHQILTTSLQHSLPGSTVKMASLKQKFSHFHYIFFKISYLHFIAGRFHFFRFYLPTYYSFIYCFSRQGFSVQFFVTCPGTHSIDQVGLKFTEICLPLPPECWD